MGLQTSEWCSQEKRGLGIWDMRPRKRASWRWRQSKASTNSGTIKTVSYQKRLGEHYTREGNNPVNTWILHFSSETVRKHLCCLPPTSWHTYHGRSGKWTHLQWMGLQQFLPWSLAEHCGSASQQWAHGCTWPHRSAAVFHDPGSPL